MKWDTFYFLVGYILPMLKKIMEQKVLEDYEASQTHGWLVAETVKTDHCLI